MDDGGTINTSQNSREEVLVSINYNGIKYNVS